MTPPIGAVGAGQAVDQRWSQPPAPGRAATFAQALSTALASQPVPPAPAASGGSTGSITLGQMVGMHQLGPAGLPAPAGPATPLELLDSAEGTATGMLLPAAGRVSSEFGPRVHPITGQRRPHTGIDVAAPTGAPIRAAAAGEVTFAGTRGGYGNLVIVDHGDGRETYYAHNSANHVAVGDRVAAGQHIAAVGATGTATGPHLHFEVRVNGEPAQPRDHVSFP